MPEFFVNGKNAMSVGTVNKFKRHRGRTFLTVFNATGRTKAALTAERREFHISAVRAGVHGAAKGRIAAVDHLGDVFHFYISWMKRMFNNFIIVFKNVLKNVHKIIMKRNGEKRKTYPSKIEGQGS